MVPQKLQVEKIHATQPYLRTTMGGSLRRSVVRLIGFERCFTKRRALDSVASASDCTCNELEERLDARFCTCRQDSCEAGSAWPL